MRITTAYFPHSGYSDTHIQQMYDTIAPLLHEANTNHMHFVMGADCNARVGEATDEDDRNTIGQYGLPPLNTRGQWLKGWAAIHRLTITNTFFKKQPQKYATYTGPNKIPRQIDYLFANHRFWKTVKDCESSKTLDLGSDHNALRLRSTALRPKTSKPPRTKRRTIKPKAKWPPTDTEEYETRLSQGLDDLLIDTRLELKCEQIE